MDKRATHDDLDLMLLVDGELPAADSAALRVALAADEEGRRKIEALGQVGEVLRTHIELRCDEAEPRLDRLWHRIERTLAADAAPAASTATPRPGIWPAARAWLERYRGHIATGAVAAAAAALLVVALRPAAGRGELAMNTPPAQAVPQQVMISAPTPPEVEELEVPSGSGAVLTIPSDREGEADTAVIWVTPADSMEGPL